MKENRNYKCVRLLVKGICMLVLAGLVVISQTGTVANAEGNFITFSPDNEYACIEGRTLKISYTLDLEALYAETGYAEFTLNFASSNEKIVSVQSQPYTIHYYPGYPEVSSYNIWLEGKEIGWADITVSVNGLNFSQKIVVTPAGGRTPIANIEQKNYNTADISWEGRSGCSGYVILRREDRQSAYEMIKQVSGDTVTNTDIPVVWNKTYEYRVEAYMEANGQIYYSTAASRLSSHLCVRSFTASEITCRINKAEMVDDSHVKLSWDAVEGAESYEIFVSDSQSGDYRQLSDSGNRNSLTYQMDAGEITYFKIKTCFPGALSSMSDSISVRLPVSGKVKKLAAEKISAWIEDEQYGFNWSSPDRICYYVSDGKFHAVEAVKNGFVVYTFNQSMKVEGVKKIKIKYKYWGAFYAGEDGSFYVALGYPNNKESESKTVIKVIKYDSKWKKLNTASIKGGVSNEFKGIYTPFDAGNCRMEMIGDTLYLQTCRLMFKGDDGVRHQSNISFAIDTKTMEAKEANESYCSHSFNQFVKKKEGNLFILDHGDAYPRGIKLTKIENYGETDAGEDTGSRVSSKVIFPFKGETGDNNTGCCVGGMELSGNHVLVCGTSLPHSSTVKGISGFNNLKTKNVFILAADQNTGETKVNWLTEFSPKSGKYYVGETRMVKIDDNHFAVMYQLYKGGKDLGLQYVVVDENGDRVYGKSYKKVKFSAGSQPLIYKGYICFLSTVEDANNKEKNFLYRIPAKY